VDPERVYNCSWYDTVGLQCNQPLSAESVRLVENCGKQSPLCAKHYAELNQEHQCLTAKRLNDPTAPRIPFKIGDTTLPLAVRPWLGGEDD
jgi:hypothetical protein